jgi:uncharacterized protein YggL (DUF469 family)
MVVAEFCPNEFEKVKADRKIKRKLNMGDFIEMIFELQI